MSETKKQLSLHLDAIWKRLQEVAKELKKDETNWVEVHEGLNSCSRFLDQAKGITSHYAKGIMYAVGVEREAGEFGMIHGPVPNLTDMLEVTPPERGVIFRFNGPHTPEEIICVAKLDEETQAYGWVAVDGKL